MYFLYRLSFKSRSIHEVKINYRQNNPWKFLKSPLRQSIIQHELSVHWTLFPLTRNSSLFLLPCAAWSIQLLFRGRAERRSTHLHTRIKFNALGDLESASFHTRYLETDSMWDNSRFTSSTSWLCCVKSNTSPVVVKIIWWFAFRCFGFWLQSEDLNFDKLYSQKRDSAYLLFYRAATEA